MERLLTVFGDCGARNSVLGKALLLETAEDLEFSEVAQRQIGPLPTDLLTRQ